MFPTSSSTLLVGKNARSAAARIKAGLLSRGFGRPPLRRARGKPTPTRVLTNSEPSMSGIAARRQAAFAPGRAWYVARAVTRWRVRSSWTIAAAVLAGVSGCGGGARQDVNEPTGKFPVSVTTARFPASQRLAQHTHLVIAVRNAGSKTIPDVAVTVCNISCDAPAQPGSGTGTSAFSENIKMPGLANRVSSGVDRRPASGPVPVQLPFRRPWRRGDCLLQHLGSRPAGPR